MKAHKLPRLSIEEYKKQELDSGIKYEYHDGQIFALAGGSLNHGLLCGNIFAELRNSLKRNTSNCKALSSEIKLFIQSQNSFVYPDSMVICGEIEQATPDNNAVTNPVLIVEVLSPSTASYDRGDKFYLYRQIPSLQEYVLIEQDKAIVEVYCKKSGSDLWSITRFKGLETSLKLQSIGIHIKMADLYFDVNLDT